MDAPERYWPMIIDFLASTNGSTGDEGSLDA
jgi:hypothetical protein